MNFIPRRDTAGPRPRPTDSIEVGTGCRDGHCPSGRSRTPAPTDSIGVGAGRRDGHCPSAGGRGRPPLQSPSDLVRGKFILYYFFFFLYSLPHFTPVNPAPKIPHKPHGYTLPKRGVRWKEHLVEKRRKPTQIKGLDGFFCGKDR